MIVTLTLLEWEWGNNIQVTPLVMTRNSLHYSFADGVLFILFFHLFI